jgi:hypothetical protein
MPVNIWISSFIRSDNTFNDIGGRNKPRGVSSGHSPRTNEVAAQSKYVGQVFRRTAKCGILPSES